MNTFNFKTFENSINLQFQDNKYKIMMIKK